MASQGVQLARGLSVPDLRDYKDTIEAAMKHGGHDFQVVITEMLHEAPDALAEVHSGFTAEFDGSSTPVALEVVSSDNGQDKAGGTGALEVTLVGIGSVLGRYTTEVFTLAGTTPVEGSTLFKRILGAYISKAGTGTVGVGNIQVRKLDGSAVYATITAGDVCTINHRIYVPTGYEGVVAFLGAHVLTPSSAATAIVFALGAIVNPRAVAAATTTAAVLDTSRQVNVMANDPALVDLTKLGDVGVITGDDDAYFTLRTQSLEQDNNTTMRTMLVVLIYKRG